MEKKLSRIKLKRKMIAKLNLCIEKGISYFFIKNECLDKIRRKLF